MYGNGLNCITVNNVIKTVLFNTNLYISTYKKLLLMT